MPYDSAKDAYIPHEGDIAGLDLIGYRNQDGTVSLGHPPAKKSLADFPRFVRVNGSVFILETIRKNDDPPGKIPPGTAGHNIEWGIYV